MTGNTPTIDVSVGDPVNAGQSPEIDYNNDNPDEPQLTLHLPMTQKIDFQDLVELPAKSSPQAEYDDTQDINNPKLTLKIPKTQVLGLKDPAVITLDAGKEPEIIFDDITDVNNPTLQFKLPTTQKIGIRRPITKPDVGTDPDVNIDNNDINNPKLVFTIPKSQKINAQPLEKLDAGDEPEMIWDETEDVNNPKLTFKIPKSQAIQTAVLEEALEVGEDPKVRLDIGANEGDSGDINNPILKLKLPKSQEFVAENVSAVSPPLDADQPPTVNMDTSESKSKPKLVFSLPRAQVMVAPDKEIVGPAEDPNVIFADDSTVNNPKLKFIIPRATKFYYGNLLDNNTIEQTITDATFVGYKPGDYYINITTGFIHEVKEVAGTTVKFHYVACLQAPDPEVNDVEVLDPYSDTYGTPTKPTVSQSVSENGWSLTFGLPKAPTVTATAPVFVGSTEEGSLIQTITKTGITLTFTIPAGARLYSGANFPITARPGDLFLNSQTGEIYSYFKTNGWQKQEGNLKGPQGDALHIAGSFSTNLNPNELDNGVNYIKAQLGSSYVYKNDEVFSFTQTNTDGTVISYWYFCYDTVNDKWDRVQLTGNTANLIEQDYYTGADVKAYSTKYVNTLINNSADNKTKTTYSKDKIEQMISWGHWNRNGDITEN